MHLIPTDALHWLPSLFEFFTFYQIALFSTVNWRSPFSSAPFRVRFAWSISRSCICSRLHFADSSSTQAWTSHPNLELFSFSADSFMVWCRLVLLGFRPWRLHVRSIVFVLIARKFSLRFEGWTGTLACLDVVAGSCP